MALPAERFYEIQTKTKSPRVLSPLIMFMTNASYLFQLVVFLRLSKSLFRQNEVGLVVKSFISTQLGYRFESLPLPHKIPNYCNNLKKNKKKGKSSYDKIMLTQWLSLLHPCHDISKIKPIQWYISYIYTKFNAF